MYCFGSSIFAVLEAVDAGEVFSMSSYKWLIIYRNRFFCVYLTVTLLLDMCYVRVIKSTHASTALLLFLLSLSIRFCHAVAIII